jgi:methyl-accepting chemotaxis protein
MNVLNRLSFWNKLLLLMFSMLLPLSLLGYRYIRSATEQLQATERELAGARYLAAVSNVLNPISRHRGQSGAFLNGEASLRARVLASQAEADTALQSLDALDAQYAPLLGVQGRWAPIKAEWLALKDRALTLPSADETYRQHSVVMNEIDALIGTVTDNSGLTLDPETSTYYLQNVAFTLSFPALADFVSLRGKATTASAHGGANANELPDILTLKDNIPNHVQQLRATLEKAWVASPAARAATEPRAQDLEAAAKEFTRLVYERLAVPGAAAGITLDQAFDSGDKVATALLDLQRTAVGSLVLALEQRAGDLRDARRVTCGAGLAVLLFIGLLGWLISRAMTRPMARAIEVFHAVSAGKYDNVIEQSGSDEAAQVLRALDEMQGKLRYQIETERSAAAANARMKQALDSVSSNVMVADERQDIIYANPASERLFKNYEADLRRDLPKLDSSRIVGSSLDVFQPNSSQQRELLAGPNSTHTSEVRIGGRAMRIVASPVIDAQGLHIGTVVEWFDRTQEVNAEEEVSEVVKAALAGDLAGRLRMEGKTGFFQSLSQGLNQLLEATSEIVKQVTHAAADVHRGADEISQGNANLSQRTEEQSSSLEETASSMEEMTSTVKQNADNAAQANQLAGAARDQAEKGGAVTSKAVSAMSAINDSSRQIAAIIGVIDEIAFQTNLLALNAAVEAARAGEQGRGFAVVASEVRSLAGRSATAAKEIKDLIQDSVQKVEDGSALVSQSGQTLEQIVVAVKKVSDIVAEIAAASREQSSGIEQVNKAVMQMDEITQQNAALVEQASAASQSMAERAKTLTDMMSRYRITGSTHSQSEAAPGASTAWTSRRPPDISPRPTAPIRLALSKTRAAGRSDKAGAAPIVERRKGGRPWSDKSQRAPIASAQNSPAETADSEWQEF